MPAAFRPLPSISSAPDSLRSQQFLTPPVSHKSAEDIPFKPDTPDDISLSMKRSRNHRHGRHDKPCRHANAGRKQKARQCSNRASGIRRRSHRIRKTLSLPSVQPRFDLGTVELLQSPHYRARRWTVPSKASSTQGLATLVPVDVTARTADPSSVMRFDSDQSPAMITLRRATTTRSRKHTSLTSFPPPKFRRDGSGLLSTFLNSITGYEEVVGHGDTQGDRTRQVTQKPRTSSTVSREDIRPSTSTAAPPVQTEVVTVEPRLSYSGPNQAAESIRRCSTRYVSNNVVYEIIWDENCSSSGSDGELPSPHGQASLLQSRDLIGLETLERRLSKTLSQSRRDSSQESWRNKSSNARRSTLSMQSMWINPKISRLFPEPVSGTLPHCQSSKCGKIIPSLSTDFDINVDPKRAISTGVSTNVVEFFPPLRSRVNTNGSGNLKSPWTTGFKDIWGAAGRLDPAPCNPSEESSVLEVERRRYGSMVGISSHTKRRSASAEEHLQRHWARTIKSCSRRASESKTSDEEMRPLLQTT